MIKKLNKSLNFGDIHLGKKQNSEMHNQDCLDFIKWVVQQVKSDPEIDHINFLGDWHEHRNAINGLTLDYSYRAAELLNSIGIPVYFIIGNHDLYFRRDRSVHTTAPFQALNNFHFINEITPVDNIGDKGTLYVPFLFEEEYPKLLEYTQYPVVLGHFEFKGFVLTGETHIKEHGPDHTTYNSFKRIYSGHYHKRQSNGNVQYIGSTHPMDYSDAGDINRGVAIYNYKTDKLEFINWPDCPSYTYCKLSQLIASPSKYLVPKGNVKAFVDIDIEQNESILLKEKLVKKYNVRELVFVENNIQSLDGDTTLDDELKMESIDTVIKHKLKTVQVDNIDTDYLIKIYEGL